MWGQLNHTNILQFLGVCETDSMPFLVSPVSHNGGLIEFLRGSADIDRVMLVRTADSPGPLKH